MMKDHLIGMDLRMEVGDHMSLMTSTGDWFEFSAIDGYAGCEEPVRAAWGLVREP
jgi:hypothetical protein